MDTASTIKQARRAARLSQTELARMAGTSQATVSAYESGSKRPSVATLSRLLGVTGRRLETVGAGLPAPAADESTLAERGKRVAEVLALAEALPARRRAQIEFPPLAKATKP